MLFCVLGMQWRRWKNGCRAGNKPQKNGLVGLWLTQGIDPDLGAVNVAMTLRADGKLTIVQELPAGARLSFSGTWELDDAKLTLNGVYFAPGGQSQVGCQITQAGLELKDEAGKTQIWRRAE
jgi:hypothetical protein